MREIHCGLSSIRMNRTSKKAKTQAKNNSMLVFHVMIEPQESQCDHDCWYQEGHQFTGQKRSKALTMVLGDTVAAIPKASSS